MKRKPNRLESFDYGSAGHFYYVTICTYCKLPIFGSCGEQLYLSTVGQIVHDAWTNIPSTSPHVRVDEFVVMPNHLHGILFFESQIESAEMRTAAVNSAQGTLATVIGSFKSWSRKTANQVTGHNIKMWQRGFYDHIIRTEKGLHRIRQYIRDNPTKWYLDELNVERARRETRPYR
jgi:REP element-mobilizing transposase RayT